MQDAGVSWNVCPVNYSRSFQWIHGLLEILIAQRCSGDLPESREKPYVIWMGVQFGVRAADHNATGFPRSWKILEKIAVMEKSWNMKISQKVMESSWMSWKSHGIACSHGCGSFLVCDCRACCETVLTISEILWEWVSWKEANQSWNSVFWFLWEPWC